MALIVDPNGNDGWAGTEELPLKTIGRALELVEPGGTILLRTGVYKEKVKISTPGIILGAAQGHKPVISGNYIPSQEFDPAGNLSNVPNNAKSSWVVGHRGNQESLVKIQAGDVTLMDLKIEHVAGKGIVIQGNNATLFRVNVDFCYGSLLLVKDVSGATILDSTFTRGSWKLFDPNREGAGPSSVQVSVLFKGASNCEMADCLVAYCGGEGISAGANSRSITVRRTEIHNCNHVHAYSVHAKNTQYIDCLIWVAQNLTALQYSGNPSDGIVIGNETGRSGEIAEHQVVVEGCKVLGVKRGIQAVRNGKNYAPTWLINSRIVNNEVYGWNVFGPSTKPPNGLVHIATFDGYPHKSTVISGNTFLAHSDRPDPVFVGRSIGQVTASNNVWSHTPPSDLRSDTDVVGLNDERVEWFRSLCVDDMDHTADHIVPKRLWYEVMEEPPYVPPEPEPEPEPPTPEPEPPASEPEPGPIAKVYLEAGWYEIRKGEA